MHDPLARAIEHLALSVAEAVETWKQHQHGRISPEDQALLDGLLKESVKNANRLAKLDARTPKL